MVRFQSNSRQNGVIPTKFHQKMELHQINAISVRIVYYFVPFQLKTYYFNVISIEIASF